MKPEAKQLIRGYRTRQVSPNYATSFAISRLQGPDARILGQLFEPVFRCDAEGHHGYNPLSDSFLYFDPPASHEPLFKGFREGEFMLCYKKHAFPITGDSHMALRGLYPMTYVLRLVGGTEHGRHLYAHPFRNESKDALRTEYADILDFARRMSQPHAAIPTEAQVLNSLLIAHLLADPEIPREELEPLFKHR